MKLLLEMVVTSSACTWVVFFAIMLENLPCWRGKLIWSSIELWKKENRCLTWQEIEVARYWNELSLALCGFCCLPHSAVQGVQFGLLLLMVSLTGSWVSAQRIPQSQQDCFCGEKAKNYFLALHPKTVDFLTKVECSIKRVSGTLSSAMKPGE